MSLTTTARLLPARLSRTFATSVTRRDDVEAPAPSRRKGRTPKVNPKTQPLLSTQKLRSLVSLYHQTDDFITPENLLQRIDDAFLENTDHSRSAARIRHEAYERLLAHQRSAPKMSPWNFEGSADSQHYAEMYKENSWSGSVVGRERQVIEALYGVEALPPTGQPLPGYETLLEASETLQKEGKDEFDEGVIFPKTS